MAKMNFKTVDGNTGKIQELIEELNDIKSIWSDDISSSCAIANKVSSEIDKIVNLLETYKEKIKSSGEKMYEEAKWVNF